MNTLMKTVTASGADGESGAHAAASPASIPNPDSEGDDGVAASQLAGLVFHRCPVDPGCPYCGDTKAKERAPAYDWSFIDGAYCISLQSRPDRAADAAAELHRVRTVPRDLVSSPGKE